MRRAEWIAVIVLMILGAYFLLFHVDPLPLNHEAVGLGRLHILHDVIGIVLLAIAGLVWWRSRRTTKAAPTNGS